MPVWRLTTRNVCWEAILRPIGSSQYYLLANSNEVLANDEQYSAETGKINETRAAIIKEYSDEYGTLTDDQADNLIRRWLDTDIELAKLRQRYGPVFRKVLAGKKAATFFQLDRRINMMIDVQLTSQLPLAQSQG